MKIKISEITKIIQSRIANYQFKNQKPTSGKVISVSDGVAIVKGLQDARYFEALVFANGSTGLAFSLEVDYVGVIILDHQNDIKEGDQVQKTDHIISISVGSHFLGRVIDPLCKPLDDKPLIQSRQMEIIEKIAPGVIERESVNQPLETGILAIDSLLPIGKGQRELIIGDSQTGKTTLTVDTIINQKGKNVVCVYVSIGQKTSSVLEVVHKLKENNALNHTIIVVASAFQSEAMRFLAPFAGMTHAEFFLQQGKDVLIVFDDLSKHAVAYRGLSLLLRRTPGRQAYPGDIFYLHSRLLERSVKLNAQHGGGSITALPIIETQLDDLTAYIPTNVISITDGQIFLLHELFNLGFKPAIDYGLSVSRVGSTAQISAIKKTVGSLKLDLASYKELQVFAQLGGNLDSQTQIILNHGQRIVEILKQREGKLLAQWMMVIILLAIKKKLIDQLQINQIADFKKELINHFQHLSQKNGWIQELIKTKIISHELEVKILKDLNKIIDKFNFLNDKSDHSKG